MKIILSNIIPFKGYSAINIFSIIFVRKDYYNRVSTGSLKEKQRVHFSQFLDFVLPMQELLYVFFYIWYGLEYLIKLCYYFNFHKAYKNISFEREAYEYENDYKYLENRKHYSWFKYIIF